MSRKHVVMILFALILVQGSFFVIAPPVANSSPNPAGRVGTQSPVQTAGAGGENPLITNVISAGGFEAVGSYGAPYDWSFSSSGYANQSTAYRALTYSGIYSGELEAKGTPQQWGYSYLSYNPPTPQKIRLTQGITLDFCSYIVSNPNLMNGARIHVSVLTSDSGYGDYYIDYYLSYRSSGIPSNTSQYTYFGLNETMGFWHLVSRNVTADFQIRFGTPSPTRYVYRLMWEVNSPDSATGLTKTVLDEVSITNRTAYEFAENGDFETGNGNHWSPNGISSPGYVYSTTDHTEGSRAANLSCKAMGLYSNGYAYVGKYLNYPQGLYAAQPGSGIVEFDWKYTDTHNGGTYQEAYLEIYASNQSSYCYVDVYLGRDLNRNPQTNSTNSIVMNATGFGTLGWQHEVLDLGLLFQQVNIRNVDISQMVFNINIGDQANSSVTLLIDDFQFRTYPTIDPGFEQDWYWSPSSPLAGWWTEGWSYPYVNRTSDHHSGNWAANITVSNTYYAGLYRYPFVRINQSIFTDFWFKVNDITSVGDNNAFIMLSFDGGFSVTYVVAASSSYSPVNDTGNVYYFVNGFNQTGTWKNVVRNVQADLEARFSHHSWNLTKVDVYATTGGGGSVSVLFDDMNFVCDTHAPNLTFVGLEGAAPTYYRQANVRIELTDLNPVTAAVYYNNGSGWIRTAAANMGGYFLAHIPSGPFGTLVLWYANATDSLGHSAIDNNHGSYYSYVIGDDIPPVIDSIRPKNSTVVTGVNNVKVNTTDPGVGSSGVSHVELWLGSNLLANDSSAPYQLMWNTRLVANGTHTLTIKAVDNAGESSIAHLYVNVENDVAGPSISGAVVNPSHPEVHQSVTVSVGVADATGVASVTLNYKVSSGDWQTLSMSASGALYSAVIPGADYGKSVSFYIVAIDVFGQPSTYGSVISPQTYAVVDTIDPTIGVTGPTAGSKLIGLVRFNVSATDSGSGIANVTFLVDGSKVDMSTATPWVYEWNTGSVANGLHTIRFTAGDKAGNVVSVSIQYDIENPQGLDAVGYVLQSFMSQFGIVVGVAAVLGLVLVFKLIMARRQTK